MSDNRSHMAEKYQWDLSTIFRTDEDWEQEMSLLTSDIENAKENQGFTRTTHY